MGIKMYSRNRRWKVTYRSHFDFRCRQNQHARDTRFIGVVDAFVSAMDPKLLFVVPGIRLVVIIIECHPGDTACRNSKNVCR